MTVRRLLAAAAFALLALPGVASAQLEDDLVPPSKSWISPESFALELRVGPYDPDGRSFDAFYDDDSGPLLAVELDVIAWRFEDLVYLAGGGGIGTASFSGHTLDMLGERTSEETSFSIIPLQLLAVVRVDALARKLSVPFILTGKLGYQWASWDTDSGGADDASGWSVGMLWAAQIALDLDFFEPSAARQMDEEWGINHSFLFFELYGFEHSSQSLPLGGKEWAAGLGFMF